MIELRKMATIGRRLALASAGVFMIALGAASQAETVAIPLGQQGKAWNVETPKTGMRKDQVEARFGTPNEKSGPVGEPPIYTWDYQQFTVYFEGDYVIHSVVKVPPKQQ
jgi:hypothetical protein